MYNEANGIIYDGNYLGNFQMDLTLDLLFFGSKDESILVSSKVVVDPTGEETMPNFERSFHSRL